MRLSRMQVTVVLATLTGVAFASYGTYRYVRYEEAEKEYAKATEAIQGALDQNLQDIRDNLGPIDDFIKLVETASSPSTDVAKTESAVEGGIALVSENVDLFHQAHDISDSIQKAIDTNNPAEREDNILKASNDFLSFSKDLIAASQQEIAEQGPANLTAELLGGAAGAGATGAGLGASGAAGEGATGAGLRVGGAAGAGATGAGLGVGGAAFAATQLLFKTLNLVALFASRDQLLQIQSKIDDRMIPKLMADRAEQGEELAKLYVKAQGEFLRKNGLDPASMFALYLQQMKDARQAQRLASAYAIVDPQQSIWDQQYSKYQS